MDEAEYCDRIGLVYRGKLIALDSPDSLKQSARTDELPSPTMEEAFIELINRFDEREKSTTPPAAPNSLGRRSGAACGSRE
jgi:ABC-2 type transport system ATP-binding protein